MERLNLALAALEERITEPVDAAELARIAHVDEHHFRRMFATLAGMGLGTYIRRRRMTLAASDVVADESTLLDIATRHGYTSADAFARAFRDVHGVTPTQAREPGALLSSQSRITFRLRIEGTTDMQHRIVELPGFSLVGPSARLPLVHHGVNDHVAAFVASIPVDTTIRMKQLNDVEPRGVLAACSDFDDTRADGSVFTYRHCVATSKQQVDDREAASVPGGSWLVLEPEDATDAALQDLWPYAFAEWFPANGYSLAPGPEIVAMQVDQDTGTLVRELWLPIRRDAS